MLSTLTNLPPYHLTKVNSNLRYSDAQQRQNFDAFLRQASRVWSSRRCGDDKQGGPSTGPDKACDECCQKGHTAPKQSVTAVLCSYATTVGQSIKKQRLVVPISILGHQNFIEALKYWIIFIAHHVSFHFIDIFIAESN